MCPFCWVSIAAAAAKQQLTLTVSLPLCRLFQRPLEPQRVNFFVECVTRCFNVKNTMQGWECVRKQIQKAKIHAIPAIIYQNVCVCVYISTWVTRVARGILV
ncbi:hypothetical protein FKM82_008019 [Ascaphus truei]